MGRIDHRTDRVSREGGDDIDPAPLTGGLIQNLKDPAKRAESGAVDKNSLLASKLDIDLAKTDVSYHTNAKLWMFDSIPN